MRLLLRSVGEEALPQFEFSRRAARSNDDLL